MKSFSIILILILSLSACSTDTPLKNTDLPILGFRDFSPEGDTIFHTIPDFSFVNQDSNLISNKTLEGKVYVSDFFFIHCPTICPKVKAQMMRVYEKFEDRDDVILLSHSIDTRNDTVAALKKYANKLDVKTEKWHFLTGDHDLIYSMADAYYVVAMEDKDAPGGFDHSGQIILVDENRHIRANANGTDPEDVDQFLLDIEKLLDEKN